MSTVASALIPELEQEAASTRRLLSRVPADHLTWAPHPKSMTLGQLALHVARIPGSIARLAQQDGLDATTVNFTPPSPERVEELLQALESGVTEARGYLAELGDAAALATWRLTAGDREVFAVPRLGLVRSLMLNHWYHHRGQLTVYLRLLEIPVPAIYGRSADENPFTT